MLWGKLAPKGLAAARLGEYLGIFVDSSVIEVVSSGAEDILDGEVEEVDSEGALAAGVVKAQD